MNQNIMFGAFTKPWPKEKMSLDGLGKLLSGMGFDCVEFCVRDGYQVEPSGAGQGLKELVKVMESYKIRVSSIAGNPDEALWAACREAGIPIVRTLAELDLSLGYDNAVGEVRRNIEAMLPLCETYGVKLGIQHHFGPMISHSMELYQLLKEYDPNYVGAIWDSAQSALAGEEPEQGLDIIWPYLCLVNLKNVFYQRTTGPESEAAWTRYFTTGRQGLASWPRIAAYLNQRQYKGAVILTHEYTDQKAVNTLLAEDLHYARTLF